MVKHSFNSILKPIYKGKRVREKFDKIGKLYGLINMVGRKPNREGMKFVKTEKGERILEIGIGTGSSLEEMILASNLQDKIYGVDSSYGMVNLARNRLYKKGIKKVNILCADARNLPFRNNTFSLIFCSGLFDSLTEDDSLKALKEIKRILKPKGKLVAINMTKKGDEILRLVRILYEWAYPRIFRIFGIYRPLSRPIYFEDTLKKAGYSIEWNKITTILFFPFPVEIILARV